MRFTKFLRPLAMYFCFSMASAAGAAAETLNGLCAHDVEGSYSGSLGTEGSKIRVNLICLSADRMVATITLLTMMDGKENALQGTNFSYSAIDENQLVLSDFSIAHDDRKGHSSKGLVSYLKVDLAGLKAQQLHGTFMHGTQAKFRPVEAKRDQVFPKFAAALRSPLRKANATGTFGITQSFLGSATLIFDVLGDTPVVALRSTALGRSIHMLDGPVWDGNGTFSSATPEGNGGEPDDQKMYYIRGRYLTDREIEFFIVTPNKGLQGPLHAIRE